MPLTRADTLSCSVAIVVSSRARAALTSSHLASASKANSARKRIDK